jgi:hypothetical protein
VIAGMKEVESSRLLHGKPHGHPDSYIRGDAGPGQAVNRQCGSKVSEKVVSCWGEGLGSTSVNDEFVRWSREVPRTVLRQHVPGTSTHLASGFDTNAANWPQVPKSCR